MDRSTRSSCVEINNLESLKGDSGAGYDNIGPAFSYIDTAILLCSIQDRSKP